MGQLAEDGRVTVKVFLLATGVTAAVCFWIGVCAWLIAESARTQDVHVVVKELTGLLGRRVVAYIAHLDKTSALRPWFVSEKPPPVVEQKFRFALRIALMIEEHDDVHVVQAWFQGSNPQLLDRAPAQLLRDGDLDEVGPQILDAARAFLVGG